MLIGCVIHHQVHHELDAARVHCIKQLFPIRECAKFVHNVAVIADVITVVVVRRFIDRTQPYDVDAELLQIIELFQNPAQVAAAVAVAVLETARINLIDNAFLPPRPIRG